MFNSTAYEVVFLDIGVTGEAESYCGELEFLGILKVERLAMFDKLVCIFGHNAQRAVLLKGNNLVFSNFVVSNVSYTKYYGYFVQ